MIVLNDTRPPTGAGGRELEAWVRAGGGLFVALARAARGAPDDARLLPGPLGPSWIAAGTRGGTLGFVDYSHPVFEIFKAPRSGDLVGGPRLPVPPADVAAGVLARLDDGAVALAERQVGRWHRARLDDRRWTVTGMTSRSSPCSCPFLLQTMRHLGRYQPPRVGDRRRRVAGDPTGAGPRRTTRRPTLCRNPGSSRDTAGRRSPGACGEQCPRPSRTCPGSTLGGPRGCRRGPRRRGHGGEGRGVDDTTNTNAASRSGGISWLPGSSSC